MIGYVREWGDPESIQLFVKYDDDDGESNVVILQDSEALTAEDIVDSLREQGVDMDRFFRVVDELSED